MLLWLLIGNLSDFTMETKVVVNEMLFLAIELIIQNLSLDCPELLIALGRIFTFNVSYYVNSKSKDTVAEKARKVSGISYVY